MKSQGVDPADYVMRTTSTGCWARFTIELQAAEPRIDSPPDNPHLANVASPVHGVAGARCAGLSPQILFGT